MRRGSEGAWAAHKQKAEEVRDGEDGGEVCGITMFHQLFVVVLQQLDSTTTMGHTTKRSGRALVLFKLYYWALEVINKSLTSVPSSGGLADFFFLVLKYFSISVRNEHTTKCGVIQALL